MRYNEIKSRLPRGFRVYRMPSRTKVFHGTGATFSPSEISSPFWVSTSFEVAKYFINFHDHYHDEDDEDRYEENDKGDRISKSFFNFIKSMSSFNNRNILVVIYSMILWNIQNKWQKQFASWVMMAGL